MAKRNVTVVLDEDTARWVRVEAARADKSVSRYLGDLLEARRARSDEYDSARTRFLARGPSPLRSACEPLPTRQELHERRAPPTGVPHEGPEIA